ncbi:MAG: tRNA adenosine(34) deaminase TadA [Gammaproteobacteria bacterium]|nr:tRNA adenosine(34) deaminase TadA [Gammaproteobacteria bacterium]
MDDHYWMQQALMQAKKASEVDEVPIGAVLVKDNELLAASYNQPIKTHDPSAHAEIACLRAAGQQLSNYRFPGTTMYVTLEPCAMCAGALIQARVSRLVFAAHEPRSGAVESVFQILNNSQLNHQIDVVSGIYAEQSAQLLQNFFRAKRA